MDENHPCFTQGLSTVPKIGKSFKEEIFSAIQKRRIEKVSEDSCYRIDGNQIRSSYGSSRSMLSCMYCRDPLMQGYQNFLRSSLLGALLTTELS